ncbi:MAG TPA: SlyX family protein [Pirellulales bacterium]|jgi:uncharacterized coiled-coil protein SlyX
MQQHEQLAHLADRLVRLETVVTHLEQTIQDLDQVVLSQAKQLDATNRRIEALTHQMSQAREAAAEVRKPEDEKPPHY